MNAREQVESGLNADTRCLDRITPRLVRRALVLGSYLVAFTKATGVAIAFAQVVNPVRPSPAQPVVLPHFFSEVARVGAVQQPLVIERAVRALETTTLGPDSLPTQELAKLREQGTTGNRANDQRVLRQLEASDAFREQVLPDIPRETYAEYTRGFERSLDQDTEKTITPRLPSDHIANATVEEYAARFQRLVKWAGWEYSLTVVPAAGRLLVIARVGDDLKYGDLDSDAPLDGKQIASVLFDNAPSERFSVFVDDSVYTQVAEQLNQETWRVLYHAQLTAEAAWANVYADSTDTINDLAELASAALPTNQHISVLNLVDDLETAPHIASLFPKGSVTTIKPEAISTEAVISAIAGSPASSLLFVFAHLEDDNSVVADGVRIPVSAIERAAGQHGLVPFLIGCNAASIAEGAGTLGPVNSVEAADRLHDAIAQPSLKQFLVTLASQRHPLFIKAEFIRGYERVLLVSEASKSPDGKLEPGVEAIRIYAVPGRVRSVRMRGSLVSTLPAGGGPGGGGTRPSQMPFGDVRDSGVLGGIEPRQEAGPNGNLPIDWVPLVVLVLAGGGSIALAARKLGKGRHDES